jgi:hypothetical protein
VRFDTIRDEAMNDIRIAIRALLSKPAFTVAAIVTGDRHRREHRGVHRDQSRAARAAAYAEADAIVVLNEVVPSFPNPISVSYQNYVDWRDRNRSLETIAAFRAKQMTCERSRASDRSSDGGDGGRAGALLALREWCSG